MGFNDTTNDDFDSNSIPYDISAECFCYVMENSFDSFCW